ncbi:MAG: hypothetical protein JW751_26115 [Polyangiaceae bacterium]|nr:hypothetical protein [Polyangiaceae bacterium]
MYLAGYSIECKLKVRLMEMFGVWNLRDLEAELERRLGSTPDLFTHSIEVLLELTGARDRVGQRREIQIAFNKCNEWRPAWRYAPDAGTAAECEAFLDAVETFGQFIERSI